MTPLLISAAAIIITIFLYARKPLQLALRVCAVIVMYLLLTNFSLRIDTRKERANPVVIVDYSMSMRTHLPSLFNLLSNLNTRHEILFAHESLLVRQEPEEFGKYTNITSMIEQATKKDPASVILITDGNHNYGASPITVAQESDIPIYVYGIGEEITRDVSIERVEYPQYAYRGDTIEVEAIIETGGFRSGTSETFLESATGKRIATQPLPLSEVTARSNVFFKQVVTDVGKHQYKIFTPQQAGEVSYDNNEYAYSVSVLEDKLKALYYTDHVSFNTKFILRSIDKDKHISVTAIARIDPSAFQLIESGTRINELPDIAGFDVLIFDNVNLARLPWKGIPELTVSGKGIILSGTTEGINPSWREIMPIRVASGYLHGVFQPDIIEPFSIFSGSAIPPFKNINRIVDAMEDAVIIARVNNLPVVGYRVHGRGKIFQICLVDLGEWHFMRRGLKAEDLLQNLLSDVVRFVSPISDYGRLVLGTHRTEYEFGENALFFLQAYDRDFRSAGGGDFFLIAGDRNVPFYETSMGYYEASYLANTTGKLDLRAQGELHAEELKSNIVSIYVIGRSVENERRLNRPLLQRIAASSGGEFHTLDEFAKITVPERTESITSRMINLNSPITYLVVLCLLVLDWIIRRRKGVV